MKANTDIKFENSVSLDTTVEKEEYSERDWEIICNLLEMNPDTTTAIHLNTYVEYIGDPMFECEFAKEFTIDEFVDTFGLNNYEKAKELYKINEYADKKPIILFRNYEYMMELDEGFRSMGFNGTLGKILPQTLIISNIIKVKYVDRKENEEEEH